jgi:hypothetical protein
LIQDYAGYAVILSPIEEKKKGMSSPSLLPFQAFPPLEVSNQRAYRRRFTKEILEWPLPGGIIIEVCIKIPLQHFYAGKKPKNAIR